MGTGGWAVLGLARSPAPGDPATVRQTARHFQTEADTMGRAKIRLSGIAASSEADLALIGDFAHGYLHMLEELPRELARFELAYRRCGTALDTFSAQLDQAQAAAGAALSRGTDADTRYRGARQQIQALLPTERHLALATGVGEFTIDVATAGLDAPLQDQIKQAARRARQADSDREAARRQAQAAAHRLDDAASRCAHEIDAAIEGIQNRPWWQKLMAIPAELFQDLSDTFAHQDDLHDIQTALAAAPGPEVDAVIAGMSDADLRLWILRLTLRQAGGWSREERLALWSMLLAKMSPASIARLRSVTGDFQPGFSTVGGDGARDDPASAANRASYGDLKQLLFARGASDAGTIDPNDAGQGQLGDCWYVASMMAVARGNPGLIRKAIRSNLNGTYTVTLYRDGKPTEITVTPDLPLVDGQPVFVHNPAGDAQPGTTEVWPLVMEKAGAEYFGSYHGLEGNWPSVGLDMITGIPSQTVDGSGVPPIQDLSATISKGGAIMVSTDNTNRTRLYDIPTSEGGLAQLHAYYVSGVDAAAGTVTVTNPWGPPTPDTVMSYQEFRDSFTRYDINGLGR